ARARALPQPGDAGPRRRRASEGTALPRELRALRPRSGARGHLRALARAGRMSHDHSHEPVTTGGEPPAAARVRALADLLVEKGVLGREDIRRRVDWLVSRTPADGARLVARAWMDPSFKERALDDARLAALELGLEPGESPQVIAL